MMKRFNANLKGEIVIFIRNFLYIHFYKKKHKYIKKTLLIFLINFLYFFFFPISKKKNHFLRILKLPLIIYPKTKVKFYKKIRYLWKLITAFLSLISMTLQTSSEFIVLK